MRGLVSRTNPRALAICERCGARYNHHQLQYQHQWTGPQLQNLGVLVCRSCMDEPQEQLRTIVLPPDPVPIKDPRPEYYEIANNPNSPIGQAPVVELEGSNIGTLIQGGGTYSAFMGSSAKPFFMSANLAVSEATGNWIGKDWSAAPNAEFLPSTISSTGLELVALRFEAVAPTDTPFLGAGQTFYSFQGSSDGASWTTLASGQDTGTVGETVSGSNLGSTPYRYHRFVLLGDGVTPIGVAKLDIDTNRGYSAQ